MASTLTKHVAEVVRAAMIASGHNQLSLSEATGIPRVTLRRRLAGSPFRTDELAAVADALGTTLSVLVASAEARAA